MERSFENSARGDSTGILPSWGYGTTGAARLAPADLMGRGDASVLPRLDGAATEYRITEQDHRAIQLARTITALEIAEPKDWKRANRSASEYILATLKRWIARHCGDVIRRQFSLRASITGTPEPDSDDGNHSNLLYLIVNPDSAGYVVIGPTLELLAAINSKLPVSFYRLFVNGVRRWTRVYDYDDALDRLEMLHEWLEGEENSEEYELPDVEGCIPAYMKEQPLEMDAVNRIAQDTADGRVRRILNASLKLDRISQTLQRAEVSEQTREIYMDSNPPLPALLVSFKRHDAIAGCFDEESQGMMEAEPEPNLIVEIEPGEPASVQQAFDVFATFCETMAAASRLASLLPGNEEA